MKQLDIANKITQFPIRHHETALLRATAKQICNPNYMSLWAGSNADNICIKNLDQLLLELNLINDKLLS